MSDARNIWDNLRSAGFLIQDDVTFNDYCTADSEVAVSETLDDMAIVRSVTADNQAPAVDGMPAGREDDDDDNDVDDSSERQQVTTADALCCEAGWNATLMASRVNFIWSPNLELCC